MMNRIFQYVLPAILGLLVFACSDADPNQPIGTIRPVGPEVGQDAPIFALKQPDGKLLSLADLKGKVVYIDFWASWCDPCLVLLPSLKQTWNDYRDQDFVILGVSRDYNESDWKTFIDTAGIDWRHVYEAPPNKSGPVSIEYGVIGIPRTYLIDKDGVVRGVDLVGQELRDSIDAYISQ